MQRISLPTSEQCQVLLHLGFFTTLNISNIQQFCIWQLWKRLPKSYRKCISITKFKILKIRRKKIGKRDIPHDEKFLLLLQCIQKTPAADMYICVCRKGLKFSYKTTKLLFLSRSKNTSSVNRSLCICLRWRLRQACASTQSIGVFNEYKM